MALDQNLTPSAPETTRTPAIENEIAAYRAISPFAVVSLICGVLALLSFANWFFLFFSVAAIALGLHADRKIRIDPEIWTGKGMAQAGTALGLAFGLSAVTVTYVQDFMSRRAASAYARQYVEVLKHQQIEEIIFQQFSAAIREGKTPADLYKELKSQPDPQGMDVRYGAAIKMKDRLASGSGEDVHFVRLEASGLEGVTPVVTALLEFHGPGSKQFPVKEEFALLVLKGMTYKGTHSWWVDEIRFPYVPASYVPPTKAVDDGHGHGEGGH